MDDRDKERDDDRDSSSDTADAPADVRAHSAANAPPRHGFLRRNWGKLTLLILVAGPLLVITLWTWGALGYAYSRGERAGYVQKISRKGWLCKTWEGELSMVNLPGSAPQIFNFSVRDDAVAHGIEATNGGRVVLTYEEHRGVPTSCFGETDYYVTGVRAVK